MKRNLSLFILLILWVVPAQGDFAVGGEFMDLSRKVEVGSISADSESSDALAVFLGFDMGNSMFYLRYFQEDTYFRELSQDFRKSEFSLDWHWNEQTSKKNFANLSVGLFLISYDIAPGVKADFPGFSVGGGFTRFLGGPVFFNLRIKLRLAGGSDEELFAPSDPDNEEKVFGGYDAQVAFGFLFGRRVSWSIQVGYKIQGMDFKDRFIDDDNQHIFLTTRFFVPFGNK